MLGHEQRAVEVDRHVVRRGEACRQGRHAAVRRDAADGARVRVRDEQRPARAGRDAVRTVEAASDGACSSVRELVDVVAVAREIDRPGCHRDVGRPLLAEARELRGTASLDAVEALVGDRVDDAVARRP